MAERSRALEPLGREGVWDGELLRSECTVAGELLGSENVRSGLGTYKE